MRNVLIVDDAAFMRQAIRAMLERGGFNVVGEAVNGTEGVRMYKEAKPDVVTMDITMPEMSGIEAIRHIRQFDPGARIVMVSAMGQEVLVREAIAAGAKSFIVKPFREEHVIRTLKGI